MLVRTAQPNDAAAVLALARRAHSESVWADEAFSDERATATFYRIAADKHSIVLLLCDDKAVVGILVGTLQLSYFSLDYDAVETLFYIDEQYRTLNNVRGIVKAYEYWAKSMGASATHLSMSQLKEAERITALYGKLGYGISAFVHRKVIQ
jgi:hypothetical protein